MPTERVARRWFARPASTERFMLGEGPVWDGPRSRLLWVDIHAGTVYEGSLGGDRVTIREVHRFGSTVGAVASSDSGDLVVATAQSLVVLTADGDRLPGPAILPNGGSRRLNDGKCDPGGAFVVGSLALDDSRGGEILARVSHGGEVTVLDHDLTLSNGLAWTVDGSRMYSIDSVPGMVWQRSYDAATGAAGAREELLCITDGVPDGMCVDRDGNLWIAAWGAGEVRRYTPDGDLTGIVSVPAPHTTSVAFVGPGLDQLLITTATAELTAEQREQFPDSGRLFLVDVGTTGLSATPWTPWSQTRQEPEITCT